MIRGISSVNCRYNGKRIRGNFLLSPPPLDLLGRSKIIAQLVMTGALYLRNTSNPEEFDLYGVVNQGIGHKHLEIAVD